MFWLKKVVSFWLMPLPLSLALLVAGLCMTRGERRSGTGRGLCIAGALLLMLFSNRFVSTQLLRPLEAQYAPVADIAAGSPVPLAVADCVFVAVLGGGHSDMVGLSAAARLSTSSLSRITEAVRLLGVLPGATLIVSGPGDPGLPSHASVLAAAAESLGIRPERITLIENAHDTEDESHEFARLTHGGRTCLVTSAWHMPRAAALFRKAGVNFTPCPADFVARAGDRVNWGDLAWDSESLERSTLAVHERIGLMWLWIRGAR